MIKIVVDSGCDLPKDLKENSDVKIEVVPLTLQLEDKQYIDDENLDVFKYIDDMENCKTVPKTSAPSPELYLEQYKGEESVFAITLSNHLSGSYNSAIVAKQMHQDEIGNKFIHVFDSLGASVGETVIALKILEVAKNNVSDSEMVEIVNKFIVHSRVYYILERFENLVKNGRMNPYVAKVASVLNIKPICTAVNGKMIMKDKVRGYNKAVSRLLEIMKEDSVNSDFENRVLGISHVRCLEKALAFREEVMKKFKFKDIIICEASGLCSTYAARDGIIIAF